MTEQLLNSQISKAFTDGVQFVWSATTIKMAETCLRYYQYSMIEGWHSRNLGPHLRFGSEYAYALEQFHKKRASGMDVEQATREVVREALIRTWDYETCEQCGGRGEVAATDEELAAYKKVQPGTTSLVHMCTVCEGSGVKLDESGNRIGKPWQSAHNLKSRETLIRSIIWYLDHFKQDTALPVTLSTGEAAVELNVTLEVDDGVIFSAHLDRLADYADNLYVMDQKTTGTTISARYFDQYSPDTQMSLYTFLGKAAFHMPIKGVIIDAAQIAVGFTRFERGMTFRTDGQLNEWYDGAMHHIERARAATRENYFPMNTTACGNYGGCVFRAVCGRDPGVRKNFLEGDFEKGGGYDPLERR